MKQLAKQLSLIAASVVMMLGLAVVPVGAHQGGDDDSSGSGSGSSTSSNDGNTSSDDSNTSGRSGSGSGSGSRDGTVLAENESEGTSDDLGSGHSGKLREQARQLLETKRKNGKEHSQEQRQNACENRQKNIQRRTTNFSAAAERHLGVFDKIFTRVQAFHDAKKLHVANYDTLVAAATAKQTAAQEAVDALKALDVQIDCTQSDPANSVATIKTAVADARTALKAYRTAIKDLVVALKGASTAQAGDTTTESTGGEQ